MQQAPHHSTPTPTLTKVDIENAMLDAAQRYFTDCRARVPGFIDRHFNYPGAWQTNRAALGLDLLRAPLNLIWAPFYALACLCRFFARRCGASRLLWLLDRVPAGLTTQVQKDISAAIYSDLLHDEHRSPDLDDYVVDSLQRLYAQTQQYAQKQPGAVLDQQNLLHQLQPLIDDALEEYAITRTASADITNTVACTVLGAFAFQKFTPGGIGVGLLLASVMSKALASRDFIFGNQLGGFYYSLFPPQPSPAMAAGSILLVVALLAAFASFSGLLADPVQSALGLHRRRLFRMIDTLEADFIRKTRGSYRPKDQFVARVLDLFDMVKSNLA